MLKRSFALKPVLTYLSTSILGIVELPDNSYDLKWISINPALALFLGKVPDDMNGLRAADVGLLTAEEIELLCHYYHESKQSQKPVQYEVSWIYIVV